MKILPGRRRTAGQIRISSLAMSHDLRTPLTVLNGYLEVLKLKKGDPEKQEEYIDRCLKKTGDIRALTDRMFEYALVYEDTETARLRQIPVALLERISSGKTAILLHWRDSVWKWRSIREGNICSAMRSC